jgi:hypothetical protein
MAERGSNRIWNSDSLLEALARFDAGVKGHGFRMNGHSDVV